MSSLGNEIVIDQVNIGMYIHEDIIGQGCMEKYCSKRSRGLYCEYITRALPKLSKAEPDKPFYVTLR